MRERIDQVRKDFKNINISNNGIPIGAQENKKGQNTPTEETMDVRINRVREDIRVLKHFYNIDISSVRTARLREYYEEELADLRKTSFESYDQQGKIDYLLLQNYLKRNLRQLDLDAAKNKKAESLLSFAPKIIRLCEDRQQMKPMNSEMAAQDIHDIHKQISVIKVQVESGEVHVDKSSAFRAANIVTKLQSHLKEWFGFYNGYDPLFTWWVAAPYAKLMKELEGLAPLIKEELVGIEPGDEDAIIGEPIGAEGLEADLEAEKIPYTAEELIEIGEREYVWCEAEMKKASRELGYGDDWKMALEYVKDLYVEPGQMTQLVRDLSQEATTYVKKHDLVTVPKLAEETWRIFMMSPAAQRTNPFFLGGTSMIVSYPTSTMSHDEKLMSMRGNNIHFARSTVFHEMIPGHHLQEHMQLRHRPYRTLFTTPFWIEGWALYWEMVLWDDAGFPKTPENRIGMLFWRMHRCARIIFSIKFHQGRMTPQECIDLLVDRVGHERATAEGEVRRSFNGDYSPLYQAGYMLGALQIYSLRRELVGGGEMTEKEFHDRVLQENEMPIELLRALIKEQPVTPDFEAKWRFYKDL